MTDTLWILMPIAGAAEYTPAAIADCLDQSIPTKLLLIGQGLDRPFRESLEWIAETDPHRIFCWFCDPPLPALAMAWNLGLQFVWAQGATEALVVNNDVRLHRDTGFTLHNARLYHEAFFVSAVGVTQAQFDSTLNFGELEPEYGLKGGPDFSCFLLSKEGHDKYPFDEGFTPAYCEDLDTHRRYMLGGDGDRIFSINLPYLHYASGTLKGLSPAARQKKEAAIAVSRAHYARKWGGPVNQETFALPFQIASGMFKISTPELQAGLQFDRYNRLYGNDAWPTGVCGGIYIDDKQRPPRAIACLQPPGHELPHRGPVVTRLQEAEAEVTDEPTPESAAPGPDPLRLLLGDSPDGGGVRPEPADRGGAGCDPGDPGGDRAGRVLSTGSLADPVPLTAVLQHCQARGHQTFNVRNVSARSWERGCQTCSYRFVEWDDEIAARA